MTLDVKFPLGSIAYHTTDEEQRPGLITGITVRRSPNIYIVYHITYAGTEFSCLEDELSAEKQLFL